MTHVRTLLEHSSKIFIAVLAAALIFSWTTQPAIGHHQPANKYAAAGAAVKDIGPEEAHVILSETMKVPTTHDLAISATLECSILTYLRTQGSDVGGSSDDSSAAGSVNVYVTIDGRRVPVQTTGYEGPEAHGEFAGADNGEVTFCNREYSRFVGDAEEDEGGTAGGDGIDEQRDFIETKNANAFNWFALNVGRIYDDPANGNNILLVELWAEYERDYVDGDADADTPPSCQPGTGPTGGTEMDPLFQEDCSDAYVGKRTLVAEPTNASVHEQVEPVDTPEEPGDQEPPAEPCPITDPLCTTGRD